MKHWRRLKQKLAGLGVLIALTKNHDVCMGQDMIPVPLPEKLTIPSNLEEHKLLDSSPDPFARCSPIHYQQLYSSNYFHQFPPDGAFLLMSFCG